MPETRRKFLKILLLELEDLITDVNALLKYYELQKEAGAITNYVLRENSALLKNEILGIRSALETVRDIDTSRYESLEQMTREVETTLRKKIQASDFPNALYVLLKRKIAKVGQYLAHEIAP